MVCSLALVKYVLKCIDMAKVHVHVRIGRKFECLLLACMPLIERSIQLIYYIYTKLVQSTTITCDLPQSKPEQPWELALPDATLHHWLDEPGKDECIELQKMLSRP
jgi:hypothetical protein